ncbi:hypothetical protein PAHAL_7G161200 [Panicum hallii]|uniref:Uncharacterized protein n=1 Tax=Panicum hallii TaxID=206008 RepID=A0A2T8ICH6_9POAL|nr:hypothetical protein PAHAL_7G161200 [Panicum hallii]
MVARIVASEFRVADGGTRWRGRRRPARIRPCPSVVTYVRGTARAVAPCARRLGRARSREGGRVVEVESTLKRRRNGRDGAIFTPPGSCAATASDADRRTYERVRQPAAAGPPWGERGEIASESPDHRRRADREKDPAI